MSINNLELITEAERKQKYEFRKIYLDLLKYQYRTNNKTFSQTKFTFDFQIHSFAYQIQT